MEKTIVCTKTWVQRRVREDLGPMKAFAGFADTPGSLRKGQAPLFEDLPMLRGVQDAPDARLPPRPAHGPATSFLWPLPL